MKPAATPPGAGVDAGAAEPRGGDAPGGAAPRAPTGAEARLARALATVLLEREADAARWSRARRVGS